MSHPANPGDANADGHAPHRDSTDAQHRDSTDDSHPARDRPMSVEEVRESYAGAADWLHRLDAVDRAVTGRYRRRQFGDVDGRVLDVASGTGTNFRYLDPDVDLVGIDISPEMLARARETLADLPVAGTLREMDAQALAFPDDSFDTVISALSTCTFPDPVAALHEMDRVCRPGGRILLVEHGLSDIGPVARYQRWRADAHYEKMGCRWTQRPRAVVSAAGLPIAAADTGFLGMITTIETRPRSHD